MLLYVSICQSCTGQIIQFQIQLASNENSNQISEYHFQIIFYVLQQCILLILLKSAGWNYPKKSLNYRSLPIKKMPISLLDGNIIGIKQAFSEYFEMPGCNTCKDPIVYFPPFYWYLEVMARAIEVQLQGMTSWWSNDCTKIAPPL